MSPVAFEFKTLGIAEEVTWRPRHEYTLVVISMTMMNDDVINDDTEDE